MSEPRLILYDDKLARNWLPFTLTRPAGELLFGAFALRKRAEHVFGIHCSGHVTDQALAGFTGPHSPPVIELGSVDSTTPRFFLSSRAVPAFNATLPSSATALRIGDEVVGFYCPAGTANPTESQLLEGSADQAHELPGKTLRQVWELMSRNSEQLGEDVHQLHRPQERWLPLPAGVIAIGQPRLVLNDGALIEPGVVLDFRDGPIVLGPHAEVRAYTRLTGPALIGPRSIVFGGRFSGVSIGPYCKVHGEVEETVILGYSNKAHDGFLGHAYLGAWVNLGALTTNSDLKNNYGAVRLWTPAGEVDTGQMKIGCFIGDHVQTAIGTMINTGTVIGSGSNIFGGMPPKFVPPFSWGVELGDHEFEKFISTARTAMQRRDVTLTDSQREMLQRAWQRGRALAAGRSL
ncbi:MAG: putative sugar nucleotidyl transferase [Gemmatimonadota bacterium]